MAEQDTRPKTTFFDLPAELRNHVYELAGVLKPHPLIIAGRKYLRNPSSPPSAKYLRLPALLHANQRFRDECLTMYFGGNRFVFFDLSLLQNVVNGFDKSVVSLMGKVEVMDNWHVTYDSLVDMAKRCEAKGMKWDAVRVINLVARADNKRWSVSLDAIEEVEYLNANARIAWAKMKG